MMRTDDRKINLLGLDIYSLFRSADEVIRYLDNVDPDTAMMARFQPFNSKEIIWYIRELQTRPIRLCKSYCV